MRKPLKNNVVSCIKVYSFNSFTLDKLHQVSNKPTPLTAHEGILKRKEKLRNYEKSYIEIGRRIIQFKRITDYVILLCLQTQLLQQTFDDLEQKYHALKHQVAMPTKPCTGIYYYCHLPQATQTNNILIITR
jgi:hypothetical protein